MTDPNLEQYILDALSEGEVDKTTLYSGAEEYGLSDDYVQTVHNLLEDGEIDRTLTGFELKD